MGCKGVYITRTCCHDDSQDLASFDFVIFPQLKLDLRGKQLGDLNELHRESDPTKRHGFMISTQNGFNDTDNAYSTRKSILKNFKIHRIDAVILL